MDGRRVGSGGLADEDAAGLEGGDRGFLLCLGDTGGPDDRPIGEDGVAQDRRDVRVGAVRRGHVIGNDADGLGRAVDGRRIERDHLAVARDLDRERIARRRSRRRRRQR